MTGPTPLRGSNGITFGPDGRLWVAEYLHGRISTVDVTTGATEVITGPGGPLQSPDDLVFAADGTMYVTDVAPGLVWRREPGGEFTVAAEGVRNANGIAALGNRIFVNEMTFDGRLLEITGGAVRVLADGLIAGNAMQFGADGCLYYPQMFGAGVERIAPGGGTPELVAEAAQTVAVRFGPGGVMYILSFDEAGTIVRIDGDARTEFITGIAGLDNAAFDAGGRMFVSSFVSGGITEILPGGGTREVVPRGLAGPYGVTADARGAVHVADHCTLDGAYQPFAHALAADGDLLHFTSQYGQVATFDRATRTSRTRAENLDQPQGIAVRPDGALLIAESGAGRVLAIAPDDTTSVVAEGLGRPADVAIAADGRVHVADSGRGAVYRLDDGRPLALAEGLHTPQGLTFSGGRLFVVEAGRRRLVEVGPPSRVVAADLPVALPRAVQPDLLVEGLPGVPRQFAALATAPDGALLLGASGDGSVLRLDVP